MIKTSHVRQFAAIITFVTVSMVGNFTYASAKEKTKSLITEGMASWYGYESGRTTASGEKFDPQKLTAAHKTLKFNTRLKVTNLSNNKSVIVRVNDRGPFVRGRILDLSLGAAAVIGLKNMGVGRVRIEII